MQLAVATRPLDTAATERLLSGVDGPGVAYLPVALARHGDLDNPALWWHITPNNEAPTADVLVALELRRVEPAALHLFQRLAERAHSDTLVRAFRTALGHGPEVSLEQAWATTAGQNTEPERWARWFTLLPVNVTLRLWDVGLMPELVWQLVATHPERHELLIPALEKGLNHMERKEVLRQMLLAPRPSAAFRVAMATLERPLSQELLRTLQHDRAFPWALRRTLGMLQATDEQLLRLLQREPDNVEVLDRLAERARLGIGEGPVWARARTLRHLRMHLVTALAKEGDRRLVPLVVGDPELERVLLDGFLAARAALPLGDLARTASDASVRLAAIAALGEAGDRESYRWLRELLAGWFIGREVRQAAKQALDQLAERLGEGGVGLAEGTGDLSIPER